MRVAAVLLAIGLALQAPPPAALAEPAEPAEHAVQIGVRVDGGPFARRDPRTGRFRGYLVDLCTEAATRAGFTYRLHPITAAQRILILDGDIVVRDGDTSWKLDLLCDPTTISLQRLVRLADLGDERLAFSPVVFVANGSSVELKGRTPRAARDPSWECPDEEETDKEETEKNTSVYVAGYVDGETSKTIIRREAGKDETAGLCLRTFKGHDEAVAALCKREIDYYFGDLDVIEFYRRSAADASGCAEIVPPQRVLSYEPYALLVSKATTTFRPKFIAALYELFSDGTASQRFSSHFAGASRSTALNLLFRINSVPGLRDE